MSDLNYSPKQIPTSLIKQWNQEVKNARPTPLTKKVYNQTLIITFPAQYETKTIKPRCNFTPDIIEITAMDQSNDAGNEILQLKSPMVSTDTLAVFASDNSYNPTYEYTFNKRDFVPGDYDIDLLDPSDNQNIGGVSVIIHIKYIKWNI